VFGRRKRRRFEIEANTRTVRMSVWLAALLLTRLGSVGFQRCLKPRFGTTVLFAVVGVVTGTHFTVAALGVVTKTIVRMTIVTTGLLTVDVAFLTTGLLTTGLLTTGLTLDVAFLTTGLLTIDVAFLATGLLTLDVAFLTTRFLTTGLFTTRFLAAGTVLGAVGRCVSGLVADSAGLIQERWADDFSLRSGLVLDVVAGVFLFGTSGITANFAEWRGSGDGGGGGGIERL
jgi:hypothetical protein